MALKSLDEIYRQGVYAVVFLFKVTWAACSSEESLVSRQTGGGRERRTELLLLVAAPIASVLLIRASWLQGHNLSLPTNCL